MRDIREDIKGREHEILGALGIRWPGRGSHIRCPFPDHEDKDPSWRWDKAKARWFCTCNEKGGSIFDAVIRMRGGDFKSAAQWIGEVLGTGHHQTTERAQPPVRHAVAKTPPKKTELRHDAYGLPSAIYPYPLPDGSGVYAVVARYDGAKVQAAGKKKQVLPWMFNGQRWINKRAPNPWPLYRATSFAANPDVPVLWVEGEKSAAGAEDLFPDFISSTSSGGCQQHKGTGYELLKGRYVTIWPDNDAPGRSYAGEIAKHALEAGAVSVRIVEVPNDWEEGWDLADPTDSLPDSIDLREMLEDAPIWKPDATKAPDYAKQAPIPAPKPSTYANGNGKQTLKQRETSGVFRFPITPLAAIEPVLTGHWLIKGLMPARGLMTAYGPPGCGKSFIVLNACLHIAAGLTWTQRKVKQTGVVYVAAEGQSGFTNRVWAARELQLKLPADTPFGLITVAPNLGVKNGDAAELAEEIKAQCAGLGWQPGLTVVDTVSRTMFGAKEDDEGIGAFIANCGILSESFGGLTLGVHHTGKDEARGMRGWSGLHGADDAEWAVSGEDGKHNVLVPKMKDGPDGWTWDFSLSQVEIGHDEDGEPVTTCLVSIDSEAKQKAEPENVSQGKPLTPHETEFLKAVRWAIEDGGEVLKGVGRTPAGIRGVHREVLKTYAENLNFLEGQNYNSRRATVSRHIRALAGKKKVAHWEKWVWIP